MPECELSVELDGRKVLQRKMATGTQHTWERASVSVASGEHTLIAAESRSGARVSRGLNLDRELWIAITFHGPPVGLKLNVFDHEISFM